MSDLLGIAPGTLGASGLVAIIVVLVLTGRLLPRSTFSEMRRDRDMWRAAYAESEAARREERAQANEMLELARTSAHVLESLPGVGAGVKHAAMGEASPPSS